MAKFRKPTPTEMSDGFKALCDRVALAQDLTNDKAELNHILRVMGDYSRSHHTRNGMIPEKDVAHNVLTVFWNDIMQDPNTGYKKSSLG